MSESATKQDLLNLETRLEKSIDSKIDRAIDELTGIIGTFAHQVDDRFNKIEARLDKIETNIDRLTSTIDGFVKRLDEQETENAARDAQFARLLDWAEKVAKKTGVPLTSLK